MPTLSIITVTYNRAESLQRNIASVLAQTFADIEHIVVDDMSNDGTEQTVCEYQPTAPYPVIYIREPDTGIYNAINKGLRRAAGVWTHILHSDDQYAGPSALSNVFARDLSRYDLIANAILVTDTTRLAQQRLWLPEYKSDIRHYNFPHTGVILRKAFYEKYGYYDERFRIVSDGIHNALHYPKASYLIIDAPLVVMSGAGISTRPSVRNLYESTVCVLFYHQFPWRVKAAIIRQYVFLYLKRHFLPRGVARAYY
jgi:glycosyltransferase involved in cell wall biosynthesis